MTLEDVVLCSGGLRVAQRGAELVSEGPALRVGDIAPVRLPETAPVEARRADDVVWRRHWLEPERLAIEFVGLTVVEVDEASGTVVFDRHLPREMEQHLLLDHVLPLVLARRGRLVLHGAVVSRHGKAAVLMGASGAGKSTFTAFAWQQGWTVGGDDGAVLYATDPPAVEPTYATVRLTPASIELLGIVPEANSEVVGKLRIAGDDGRRFLQQRVELRLIAIIEPAATGQPARFQPLDGTEAHAMLFGSTFHAELAETGLLPAVIEHLASIVEVCTVGRLGVPRGVEGLAAAEGLLRDHLAQPSGRGMSRPMTPATDGGDHDEEVR